MYKRQSLNNKQNRSNIGKFQNIDYIIEVIQDNTVAIKQIQKQLSAKISKNQFYSSLGTKLSISDVNEIYDNKYPTQTKGYNCNCTSMIENLRKQVKQLQQSKILQIKQNSHRSYDDQLLAFKQINNHWKSTSMKLYEIQQKVQNKIIQNEKLKREKFSQLQQLVFQKADRSQITKLLKLHEMIMIQIEQIKQQIQSNNQNNQKQRDSIYEQLNSIQFQLKNNINQQQSSKQQIKNLTKCHNEIKTIHDTLAIIQQHQKQLQKTLKTYRKCQKQQQQNSMRDSLHPIVQQSIQDCRKMILQINKAQNSHEIVLRQIETRTNLIELRESQINRALHQITQFRGKIQQLQQHLKTYQKKGHIQNDTLNKKFKQQIKIQSNNICEKFIESIKQANLYIVKKSQQFFSERLNDQVFPQLCNMKQKQKIMEDLDYKVVEKISQVDKKLEKFIRIFQNYQDQIKQKLSQINSSLEGKIQIDQLKIIIKNFTTDQQIRSIALNIQQKFNTIMNKHFKQQKFINEALCSQNVLARWLWNSGQLKGGNLIRWDKQIVNTLPQLFIWKKQQQCFIVKNSGFYKLELAIYGKKKPTLQILVNGQTIISAVNNNTYVIHHSSGKLRDVTQNSQISGISYIDFFLLPENARIAISYIGQPNGQGFIGFQRL